MIGLFKESLYFSWKELPAFGICFSLHNLAECYLQTTRQIEFKASLDDPRHTAFSGLRIDADDGLISATNILWV